MSVFLIPSEVLIVEFFPCFYRGMRPDLLFRRIVVVPVTRRIVSSNKRYLCLRQRFLQLRERYRFVTSPSIVRGIPKRAIVFASAVHIRDWQIVQSGK